MCSNIFISFMTVGYHLFSHSWHKCHIMYLWLIWQKGGCVFQMSLKFILLYRMSWLTSLVLNTVESQSETCGTSVPVLILKVNRNSGHLAIQSNGCLGQMIKGICVTSMGLQGPWIKSLKLYRHPQVRSVKSSGAYIILKTCKRLLKICKSRALWCLLVGS